MRICGGPGRQVCCRHSSTLAVSSSPCHRRCCDGIQQFHQKIKSGLMFLRFVELLSWLSLSLMVRALNSSEARSPQCREMSASTGSLQTPFKELSMSLEISGAGLTNRKFMPCSVQGLPKACKFKKHDTSHISCTFFQEALQDSLEVSCAQPPQPCDASTIFHCL